ncbi:MAG: nucleoside triphosphate pyrophosphohydrolase [Faecalibacterium sp.]
MPTKLYNKLVRDCIPTIIEADGKQCVVEQLSPGDALPYLDAKLNEELAEYQESKSLEELADLLEVMHAVVAARGWTLEELEAIRAQKAEERGCFAERLLLKEVISD